MTDAGVLSQHREVGKSVGAGETLTAKESLTYAALDSRERRVAVPRTTVQDGRGTLQS